MSNIKPILRLRRERRLTRIGKDERRVRSSLLTLGMLLSLLAGALILLSALAYASLTKDLPSVEALPRLLNPPNGSLLQPTRVYDRSGQHILALAWTVRHMPAQAKRTDRRPAARIGALADPKFKHAGYTLSGWEDPALHPTIAQRLVSDLLLMEEAPSARRAVRERILAAQVTARFGRSQVLEWYLNSIDFGRRLVKRPRLWLKSAASSPWPAPSAASRGRPNADARRARANRKSLSGAGSQLATTKPQRGAPSHPVHPGGTLRHPEPRACPAGNPLQPGPPGAGRPVHHHHARL
jgi:membrane peptidoglycan carboxypeptidase